MSLKNLPTIIINFLATFVIMDMIPEPQNKIIAAFLYAVAGTYLYISGYKRGLEK
ncbi:hypothetical protein [Erwinia phage FBB1]|nr:hypothetical protein [Erwinia phage FBB1]